MFSELWRRLSYLWKRGRLDRDLAEEMDAHAAMRGAPIGNALRLREEARDVWGWLWLDRLEQDVRYALRTLRKSPGFTVTAVSILAIGIGVNLTLFQIFDLMILRRLAIDDPESVVRFTRRSPTMMSSGVPYPAAQFYRRENQVLSAVITVMPGDAAWEDNAADRIRLQYVSANYFTELGNDTRAGRVFDESIDERPEAPPVAVLSAEFWEKRFASSPEIIGKTVRLNNRPTLVLGVIQERFPGLNA